MIKYHRDYTPVLFEVYNPVVYAGSILAMDINPKDASHYYTEDDPSGLLALTLRLGNTNVDVRGDGEIENPERFSDQVMVPFEENFIYGRVTNNRAIKDSWIQASFYGNGNAIQHPFSETCSWDGTECYETRVVP